MPEQPVKNTSNRRVASKKEKGQAIVIIAIAFVGLLAFIGLAMDFGILLAGYAHLRRAVDAASLAAAAQYREGYNTAELSEAARTVLRLNGVDMDNLSAAVTTCEDDPTDPQLCTTPKRKMVRVTATGEVRFTFLVLLGFYRAPITASAVAEAASMDMVLVIDISESMTSDAPAGDIALDPHYCNDPLNHQPCRPFEDVKNAAIRMADWVLNKPAADEEDRLAVVIFSNGWEGGIYGTQVISPGWMNDHTTAVAAIQGLKVYEPPECTASPIPGICREYPGGVYGTRCDWGGLYHDLSTCSTTNIGGGLRLAAQQFSNGPRSSALWVTVILTDGAANATSLSLNDDLGAGPGVMRVPPDLGPMAGSLPLGFCPAPTNNQAPVCRDRDVDTYHFASQVDLYDADDYARDMANLLGCAAKSPAAACRGMRGQNSLIFSVGLGQQVQTRSPAPDNKPYGDALLRYIAAVGDDADPATDPCATVPYRSLTAGDDSYSCGNYYFAEFAGGLNRIFDDIASRIFTRIAH
ncbi:MAG TPA: vWA domain-containing protein [Anaerolineaceae bacterium]|nr:vWA domain-containing protein [Anaerolineaceae bacterium]HPN51588.1 vWA domain-containing protein [Anaerolineaceae bacterium]